MDLAAREIECVLALGRYAINREAKELLIDEAMSLFRKIKAEGDAALEEVRLALAHPQWIVCPHCHETRPCGSCEGYAKMCDEMADLLSDLLGKEVQRTTLLEAVVCVTRMIREGGLAPFAP